MLTCIGFAFLLAGIWLAVFRLAENHWPTNGAAWDSLRLKIQRKWGR